MKNNQYLLVQRAEGVGEGQWQFVGGKSDGQKPEIALKREVKEETGLNAYNLQKKFEIYNPNNDTLTYYYKIDISGGLKIQEEEIADYKWFDKKEIETYPLTYTCKKAMEKLK